MGIFLFVGLGNPGSQYEETRHNMGFLCLDRIGKAKGFTPWKSRFNSLLCEGRISGHRILALKPLTFMNKSGDAIAPVCRFYKVPPEKIYVFHDDLDLLPGKIKIKQGGGTGGHRGLRSLDGRIGNLYWRIRIGIGHPGDKSRVEKYVLGAPTSQESLIYEDLMAKMAHEIDSLLECNQSYFMSKVMQNL